MPLQLHPKLRSFLIITAKHAVNVVLTNGGLTLVMPHTFHFHDWAGFLAYAKVTGCLILSREFMVWGPRLLAWSQSTTNGNGNGHDDENKTNAAGAGK